MTSKPRERERTPATEVTDEAAISRNTYIHTDYTDIYIQNIYKLIKIKHFVTVQIKWFT